MSGDSGEQELLLHLSASKDQNHRHRKRRNIGNLVKVCTVPMSSSGPAQASVMLEMAPLDMTSRQALSALAQAAVPMMYSRMMFQPMTKATNSPMVT